MKAGISTASLYPARTEDALKTLLKLGFRTFEIFLNSESEFSPEFLRSIRRSVEENGAEVYSVHPYTSGFEPFLFFTDYPRRFEDGLDHYRRYFEDAARLGARVVIFHGAHRDVKMDCEEYSERLFRISAAAAQEGVQLAQENVSRCFSAFSSNIREMRRLLGPGKVKFVLDVKQALRAGEDPLAMADAMGSDIINLHISDSRPGRDCLLPGAGTMDYGRLFRTLNQFGYKGPALIEVYRTDYSAPEEMAESERFLEACFRKNSP